MYHLSYFDIQTWDLERGGGQIDPPSVSWFLSAPAGIGLRVVEGVLKTLYAFKLKI